MGRRYNTDILFGNQLAGAKVRELLDGLVVMGDKPKTEEHIKINPEKCNGCGRCYRLCPTGSYEMTPEGIADWRTFGMTNCGECGLCRYVCPVDAIDWNYPQGGTGIIHHWS
ncbi:MAG: 4Fe-4S binding protein [Coriobacteriales bacterium]|jgi:ferredoxin like protein|nr:4Fe-4S binding protein [Coriobacteriales bacterium]